MMSVDKLNHFLCGFSLTLALGFLAAYGLIYLITLNIGRFGFLEVT